MLNRKKLVSAALVLIASFSLCACQQAETSAKEDTSVSKLPELKIGVDILKPFFYVDENGNYAGIDAEIATEACRRAGYEPDFIEISWNQRDEALQNETVDCLWSAFIKDGREDNYLWTDTYLQSNLRAIVDEKSPDQDLKTLHGSTGMAVRAGSKIEELLLDDSVERPNIQIYSCGTFEMAETAFVKGYIGALGGHEAVLREVINSYPESYRFLDGTIMTANLGVAFRKDDTSGICEKINDALTDMKEEDRIKAIWGKYTSASSDHEEVSDK